MPGTSNSGTVAVEPGAAFPRILKDWRQRRRLSQLGLSLASGVTQRHVSFLESGRSRPSRSMVLQLSDALEVPLRERNEWLLAAGFAPAYRSRPLDDPQMTSVLQAVRRMLDNHEPFPALALDRAWNIRMTNRAFDALAGLMEPDVWERIGGEARNLMRLIFHPEGMRQWMENWPDVAPLMWQRALREADAVGGEDMRAVLEELSPLVDLHELDPGGKPTLMPVLPVVLERSGLRLSLFTVISTFGTAQDVTADEMRIESFFPADEETGALLRSMAN